jgi:hypothetical protein
MVQLMARPCPRCSVLNTDDATRCDCGYDFLAREMKQSYLQPKRKIAVHTAGVWLGYFLVAGGVYEVLMQSPAAGLVSLVFGVSLVVFFRKRQSRVR